MTPLPTLSLHTPHTPRTTSSTHPPRTPLPAIVVTQNHTRMIGNTPITPRTAHHSSHLGPDWAPQPQTIHVQSDSLKMLHTPYKPQTIATATSNATVTSTPLSTLSISAFYNTTQRTSRIKARSQPTLAPNLQTPMVHSRTHHTPTILRAPRKAPPRPALIPPPTPQHTAERERIGEARKRTANWECSLPHRKRTKRSLEFDCSFDFDNSTTRIPSHLPHTSTNCTSFNPNSFHTTSMTTQSTNSPLRSVGRANKAKRLMTNYDRREPKRLTGEWEPVDENGLNDASLFLDELGAEKGMTTPTHKRIQAPQHAPLLSTPSRSSQPAQQKEMMNSVDDITTALAALHASTPRVTRFGRWGQ
jgi:hypothetical protein